MCAISTRPAPSSGVVDDASDVVDVLAVDRRVERQRQADLLHPAGDLALFRRAALVGGDAVGVLGVDVLDRELHVIEAALGEAGQPLLRQQHAGGDEVGVEARLGGGLHDVLEVAARGRLAARVQLQYAELARLAQRALPLRRRQLAVGALELDRVGAVGALQRAAVRQLGEQPDGRARARRRVLLELLAEDHLAHALTTPLSARSCSILTTSLFMTSSGA